MCHAEISDDAIRNASHRENNLEVVKYLCETCHAKVPNNAIERATTKEINEYLLSK